MTLCVVCRDSKILLGMKKRGLGVGRWNGFGGHVEKGETIDEAARREVFEESGVEVKNLDKVGIIDFLFKKSGLVLQVHIFKTADFSGQPTESDEMSPKWFEIDDIPYKKMWPDDQYWLPLLLADKKFKGKFMFGPGDVVLEYKLTEVKKLLE